MVALRALTARIAALLGFAELVGFVARAGIATLVTGSAFASLAFMPSLARGRPATPPHAAVGAWRHARTQAPRATHASLPASLLADFEFAGPAGPLPGTSPWKPVAGGNGWGNNELEYYTARQNNVSLDGQGNLAITARQESFAAAGIARSYTSARLQTLGGFTAAYGRVEARIKLPAGQGLWPAFWLLGSDYPTVGWPACGEIDVMENLGNPFTIYGSLHGPLAGSRRPYGLIAAAKSSTSLAAGFHVYGIVWSPNRIDFTLDGRAYATRTPSSLPAGEQWVFNGQPFYLLLNMAVGGNWPGSPAATTSFPATMLVNWVRVYSG